MASYVETTSRRALIDSVEGDTIRLTDLATRAPFSLRGACADVAAANVGRRADISMRVRRDSDTHALIDGTVNGLRIVSDYVPTLAEAQDWFGRRFHVP